MASSTGPIPRPSGRMGVNERAAVTRSIQAVIAQDPLFSPIPELALARERVLEEDADSTTMVMRDRRFDRSVALKVMKGDMAEPRARRFLREGLILARLCHAAIPPVFDAGRATNGQPFLMLPILSGPSFTEQLEAADAAGPMVALVARLAEAMAHAHSMGIVHGHLDPSAIVGDWITGWARARDVSGKIPDLEERPDEALDVKGLKSLVAQLAKSFDEPGLAEVAKKAHRDAAGLADDLRELLAAPPPVAGGGGRLIFVALSAILVLLLAAAGVGAFLLDKKATGLAGDLDKARAELKARDDAEARRASAEKAHALVLEAQTRARTGETDAVKKNVADALALERSELTLTLGGMAVARVGDLTEARAHLKAAAADHPPALTALVALHDLEGRAGATESLREIRTRAKDRPADQVEAFVAILDSVEAAEKKDWPKALAAGDRAIASVMKDPATASRLSFAWVCRATARFATGDVDGALADWDRAIELDPRRARSWSERSATRRAKGQLDQALADAERASTIDPKLGRAYVRRAQVHLDRGAEPQAIGDLSRAIELDAKDSEAWTLRGVAKSRRDLDAALGDFDRALDLDPRSVDALVGRGRARVSQRQIEAAIKDLTRAIDIDPRSGAAHGARGEAYKMKAVIEIQSQTSDPDKVKSAHSLAIADLDKAVELEPRNPVHWEVRAKTKQQKGDLDGALSDFNRAIELQAKSFDYFHSRGFLRLLRLEFEAAESDFTSAIEIDGRAPGPWNNRGFARIKRNKLDEATQDIDRAITIDGRMAAAWKNRGLIRQAKGDHDGAVEAFDKSLALNQGTNPGLERATYLARSDSRAGRGDADGAIADLEKCLQMQKDAPDSVKINDRIVELRKAKEEKKPEEKKPEETPPSPEKKDGEKKE